MEKPFGAEDELQVQHVEFLSVGFGDLLQVVPGEKLFAHVPDLGEIVQIKSHAVIKEQGAFVILDPRQRLIRTHVLSARR